MAASTTAAPVDHTDTESATSAILAAAAANYAKPLWLQMARLNPPQPNPTCVPHVWRYAAIRPSLVQAGTLVGESQAERRVLMLVNPARDAPFTTDTIYAGLQLVMPNETARAHRHTAFAMRFIVEGEGGFTAVQGRRIAMQRGDVILTPSWHWHDHGKTADSQGPMIWLDGLDLPNFVHFPVHFVEHYREPRYPAEDEDRTRTRTRTKNAPLVFPWSQMQARLDAAPGDHVSLGYRHADGRDVSKVLGGSAERLNAGCASPATQETASSVYHVVAGAGRSVISGKTYAWTKGDTFCIPAWQPYQHFADGDDGDGNAPVYLYRFDDKPMLRALGFYRTSDMDVETLTSD